MANITLLDKVPQANGINQPSSLGFKLLIRELIRLDIPILEIGSSSIGKSYSIREFAEENGVEAQFLFVGTEKAEFLEGIPNTRGVKEGAVKLEYLKPYWFPNKEKIKETLKKGRKELELLIDERDDVRMLYDRAFNLEEGNYSYFKDLKLKLLKFKRTDKEYKEKYEKIIINAKEFVGEKSEEKTEEKVPKYTFSNALMYLSTIEGSGNFWLILDEIDKVEKQDKDKYAPLLHIVRERELKGWKLSGLRSYPEYDIKYVEGISLRKQRLDLAIDDPKTDVTDTRIIAIANDLQILESESPALYRRFVKLIIRRTLYEDIKVSKGDNGSANIIQNQLRQDYSEIYELTKKKLHSCIVEKEIPIEDYSSITDKKKKGSMTIGEKMATIEEDKVGKALDEVNLQWTLGFLPELLFPGKDVRNQSKDFVSNFLIENFNDNSDPYDTLIFKVIADNYERIYWKPLMSCIFNEINFVKPTESKIQSLESEADDLIANSGIEIANYDNLSQNDIDNIEREICDKYKNTKFGQFKIELEDRLEIQNKKKGKKDLEGLEGSSFKRGIDLIKLSEILIKKSLIDKKPTQLTSLLISSLPFIQTQFFSNSIYVSFNLAKDMLGAQETMLSNIVYDITNKSLGQLGDDEAKSVIENVFKQITPYDRFVVKYGMGVNDDDLITKIVNKDYKAITDNLFDFVEKTIRNSPVIVEPYVIALGALKKDNLNIKYLNSISSVRLLDKEVYTNASGYAWQLILNTFDANGLTDSLKMEIDYYCEKYPNLMTYQATRFLTNQEEEDLRDYIVEKCNDVKNNEGDYMISLMDTDKIFLEEVTQ